MLSNFRRLFTEGFRVFFFFASVSGLLVIGYWTLGLAFPDAGFALPGDQSGQYWHAHEMIFGYGTAAVGGFFLTAVPNWTRGKIAKPSFVTLLALLWLAGRIAMLFAGVWPAYLVASLDLVFVPVMAANIASQLVRNPKPQNLMFLAILTLIWVANLRVHLDWIGSDLGDVFSGLRAGLLGVCAMIAILGGRITPAFTRNAMRASGVETNLPKSRKPLELVGSASAIILVFCVLLSAPFWLSGSIAIIAGVSQFLRLAGWRSFWTISKPILWSLHLGYAMLAAGYLLFGLSFYNIGSEVGAIHLLAIGAVGGMTLAVMSRASMGHTGRPLAASLLFISAYILMPVSGILRWLASIDVDEGPSFLLASGIAFCLCLTLFTICIWPIVSQPRIARK